jgi:DNA-binding NtrC family response regulator
MSLLIDLTRKIIEFIIPPPVNIPPMVSDVRPVKILLVEDDANQQEQLSLLLRQRKTTDIHVASSVTEALQQIECADIAVIDVQLGSDRQGGMTIFRRWQSVKPGQPCLVLSAYMTDDLRLSLLRDGATNALQKPVGLDIVTRLVGNYVYQVQTSTEIDNLKKSYLQLTQAMVESEQLRLRQQRTFLGVLILILLAMVLPNAGKFGDVIEGIIKLLS